MKIEEQNNLQPQAKIEDIQTAIQLYQKHIMCLYTAYRFLYVEARDESNIVKQSDPFERCLINAFDSSVMLTSDELIAYIETYAYKTTELVDLQKTYNLISNDLNKLQKELTKKAGNQSYKCSSSFYSDQNIRLLIYLKPIVEINNCFSAENLFNLIMNDFQKVKQKIDEIFTLKELKKKLPVEGETSNNNANSDKQVKEVVKIKWTGSEREFVFLIDMLIRFGFIESPKKEKHWAIFAEHFFDKTNEKEFKNTQLAKVWGEVKKLKDDKKKLSKNLPKGYENLKLLFEVIRKDLKEDLK